MNQTKPAHYLDTVLFLTSGSLLAVALFISNENLNLTRARLVDSLSSGSGIVTSLAQNTLTHWPYALFLGLLALLHFSLRGRLTNKEAKEEFDANLGHFVFPSGLTWMAIKMSTLGDFGSSPIFTLIAGAYAALSLGFLLFTIVMARSYFDQLLSAFKQDALSREKVIRLAIFALVSTSLFWATQERAYPDMETPAVELPKKSPPPDQKQEPTISSITTRIAIDPQTAADDILPGNLPPGLQVSFAEDSRSWEPAFIIQNPESGSFSLFDQSIPASECPVAYAISESTRFGIQTPQGPRFLYPHKDLLSLLNRTLINTTAENASPKIRIAASEHSVTLEIPAAYARSGTFQRLLVTLRS